MTFDVDLNNPGEVAYYSPVEVTPQLTQSWEEWKSNYVVTCMKRWIAQGSSRDDVLKCGAAVIVELNSIDDVPWMTMGDALGVKLEAILVPGDMPWQGQKRIDFLSSLRTLDLVDTETQELAAAYQLGVSLEHFRSLTPDTDRTPRERCALYRHFDAKGVLLYVGISDNPAARSDQHKAHSPWFTFSNETTVEWFETRKQADTAERKAIADERPVFNTAHNARNRKAAIEYLFAAISDGDVA